MVSWQCAAAIVRPGWAGVNGRAGRRSEEGIYSNAESVYTQRTQPAKAGVTIAGVPTGIILNIIEKRVLLLAS